MRINKLILKKYNHYIYEYVGTDIRIYDLIKEPHAIFKNPRQNIKIAYKTTWCIAYHRTQDFEEWLKNDI